MKMFDYKQDANKKQYYKDQHERDNAVKYRKSYIAKYFEVVLKHDKVKDNFGST